MGKKSDILEGLGGAAPALRRYARALCAGGGALVADELVQSALQAVGAQVRAKTLRPADHAEARIETYAALTTLAARRLDGVARPAPRHPPIIHGLADLAFKDRAALLLVSLEGFGYDAAARIVGATRETLLVRLARARAELGFEPPRVAASSESVLRRATHLRVVK